MAEKILCVYVTRQVDSNLMMASTVFRGIMEAGIKADMIFVGSRVAVDEFNRLYRKYFGSVYVKIIERNWAGDILLKYNKLAYSFLRHFIFDYIKLPGVNWLKCIDGDYSKILAFVPPYVSGAYAYKIKRKLKLTIPIIQYWTDPLTLGNCQYISEIPRSRFMHRVLEEKLMRQADKVVFFYPLLMAMEALLYPDLAKKMSWSDVSYIKRGHLPPSSNNTIIIGLFGSFHSSVRNIIPLIEAIQEFENVKLMIRGDGNLPFDISGYNNLDIAIGRLSTSDIEQLENNCDILVSLNGYRNIGPAGKTFYYASYNKPIVCIGDGAHAEYFMGFMRELGNRFIVCINEKSQIKNAISTAIQQLHDFKLQIPQRMDAAAIAKKILKL